MPNKTLDYFYRLSTTIFEDAMDLFLKYESDAVNNEISERNNCGRMSIYLQKSANKHKLYDYFADVEYNRMNGDKIKYMTQNGSTTFIPITCDLLLHTRKPNTINHQFNNLIAIEVKKKKARKEEKCKDKARLKALTEPQNDNGGVNGYVLGVYIEINSEKRVCNFEYFKNGCLDRQSTHNFKLDSQSPSV